MNTINCSCGCKKSCCTGCCNSCQFNPCAVTCQPTFTREYGYVYTTTAQTIAADEAVEFSANGILSPGISHTAGTGTIAVETTGVYLVEFYANSTAEDEFTLYQNSEPVNGASFASQATGANIGKVIVSAQRGDVITLVNTGAAEVALEADGGAVNAAVTFQRVF